MAPVVHGLEADYEGRVDFLYLNVAEARNDSAKRALGFVSTPHFFLMHPNGSTLGAVQGVVPADTLRLRLDRLLDGDG